MGPPLEGPDQYLNEEDCGQPPVQRATPNNFPLIIMMGGGEDNLPVRFTDITPLDALPTLQVEGTIATAITHYPSPNLRIPGLGTFEMFLRMDSS